MKKVIKPLFSCLLLAAAPLASAAESFVCIKNTAWVVLKACEGSNTCRRGIVKGATAIFRYDGAEGEKKIFDIYWADRTAYKYFAHVELKNHQTYIVSGNQPDLVGKIVDNSCAV